MRFKNEDEAVREIKCYGHCINHAIKHFDNGNYLDASIYLENAARSLKELDKLKVSENNETVILFGHVLSSRNNHNKG